MGEYFKKKMINLLKQVQTYLTGLAVSKSRQENKAVLKRFQGCLLGLAAGDALGTSLEFQPKGSFTPITDMCGGGIFSLKAGQWTDDTSMALCLAASLVECHGFQADDQMQRYCQWWRHGYMSSTGTCFDIGNTVRRALQHFEKTGEAFAGSNDPQSAGNGSIMRLAPVVLWFYPSLDDMVHYAVESSRTTHAAPECLDACRLMARILYRALQGESKQQVLFADAERFTGEARIVALAKGEYQSLSEAGIHGTGYVVQSLEAALWCFYHSESYKEAVLMAANLGDDADTTAAICGQIAGAYYGVEGIPQSWRNQLAMREELMVWAGRLYKSA